MKKSNLKSGMLVKSKSNKWAVVMLNTPNGDSLVSDGKGEKDTTWCPLANYNEDLEYIYDPLFRSEHNLVEVYSYNSNSEAMSLSTKGRKLLWRKEKDEIPVTVKLNSAYEAIIKPKEGGVFVGENGASADFYSFEELQPLFEAIRIDLGPEEREVRVELPPYGTPGRRELVTAFKSVCEAIGWEYNSGFNNFDKLDERMWLYFSDTWHYTPGKPRFSLTRCEDGISLVNDWSGTIREVTKVFKNLTKNPTPNLKIGKRITEFYYDKKVVIVGCQTFAFEAIESLSKEIEKLKK